MKPIKPNTPLRKPSGPRQDIKPRASGSKSKPALESKKGVGGRSVSRGAAIRAQRRNQDDVKKALGAYVSANGSDSSDSEPRIRANVIGDGFEKLKISFLGGQEAIGEKNMQVLEWQNNAIILDCGIHLGVDLPGVNYTISDTTYLEQIRHKIKGYIISHGHLDHLGALKHIVPKFPAPIFGSRFTIGVVEKTFEDTSVKLDENFRLETVIMNMDTHERLKVGPFFIELVRITHSVPESSCIVVDTPIGRIINTGDWRLDPEPLDDMPTDAERLKQLGDEGVLLLMSDSTGTSTPGRTATEHTLQESFYDIIGRAEGRVFVGIFSSNMNRVQMIVNAAVAAGRFVALDGRSMMNYAEIAVRQGLLKIPKGTVLSMNEIAGKPDDKILVICTGGQGEPNAALQRMAEGSHRLVKLHPGDTVVVSSTPIPGNEIRYEEIGNELAELGVHLYRHPTHEIDGVGPLHVSGHARRDEHREMLHLIRPKFFLPIYAGFLNRRYYQEMAIEEGWARKDVIMANNGDSLMFDKDTYVTDGQVPHGTLLVDQNGDILSGVVVKDRMLMGQEGLVAVVLTIDKKTGQLMTSPDIVSRGFIYMRDNEELMNNFRVELRRAVSQRFKRVDLDRFKQEIREHITHFLYEQTQRSPIVIPVVNLISGKREQQNNDSMKRPDSPGPIHDDEPVRSPQEQAADQQERFAAMRARLLNQDARVD